MGRLAVTRYNQRSGDLLMNRWLLVADPSSYGFEDLLRDGTAVWDGVTGAVAQKHLRGFRKGDQALIYHTAPDRAIVGTARIASDAYSDPEDPGGRRVVVDLEPGLRLRSPVSLTRLKENSKLAGMAFLRIQRIAVSPVTKAEFETIRKM